MASSTVSQKNTEGFLRALRENNIAAAQTYINNGIDINRFHGTDIPLYIAIDSNNVPMVKLLLEANATVNTLIEIESILYFAVSKGNVQIVELLLRAGANPEFENEDKETPLFKAVETNAVKIIQLLCEYNANPKHRAFNEKTPISLAKTERVKKALELCVPQRKAYQPTAKGIQTMISQFIETRGTFPIQSQKTGQCFSDSIQQVLYFADGIRDYFIERAVQTYSRVKSTGDLPLTKDAYMAALINPIKARYEQWYEKYGKLTMNTSFDTYVIERLPYQATNMYLDFTGVRFLDMFLRPIIQAPLSKKSITARRPSLVSFVSNQPTGIVCSQILNIYQITQSIYQKRHNLLHNIPASRYTKKTLDQNDTTNNHSKTNNTNLFFDFALPETLNTKGYGLLTDTNEYDFWNELLRRIPPELGKGTIKGATDTSAYTMMVRIQKKKQYAVDPKFIVGILFGVFQRGIGDMGAGHAISMVKTFGKWYVCDDNIGVALPCAPFSITALVKGKFYMEYSGFKIQYYFYDEFKREMLFEAAYQKYPKAKDLRPYVPEHFYKVLLAEVPLKEEYKEVQMYQEELEGGEGGYADLSISRKYIFWQPAEPKVEEPKPVSASNTALQTLAAKYGIEYTPSTVAK
jgi:hypothetical protein